MNPEAAHRYASQLAAAFPMQHIGEGTITEMAKEFLVIDEEVGPKVVDALKGRSAWFPTPFEVRGIIRSFGAQNSDMQGIREREEEIVSNVARLRDIPYEQALALRRGAVEDYMQEAIDHQLEGGGYWALRLRVLRDMERRQVTG